MDSAFKRVAANVAGDPTSEKPEIGSFREFLETEAKVKISGGRYAQYSFKGRQPLAFCAEIYDHVLGSHTGKTLPDSTVDICGGAQFGKTILGLNFGAYLTACLMMNWGMYLPDDDLVEGIVDTKLRPDVIEQIDWLGPMMQVGKGEDKRGRSVNRKGAFSVRDGERKAFGMIRGMGKIPTSFSMDAAMEDEKDDIPAKRSKFLTGRMTSSDLRLRSSIGTQRVHGAGQNKQFEDGSQHVMLFPVDPLVQDKVQRQYDAIFQASLKGEELPVELGRTVSVEEEWPQVCRLQLGDEPSSSDPKLSLTGDFRRPLPGGKQDEEERFAYEPGQTFYLADPATGAVIDRAWPVPVAKRPDRIKQRKWSIRISQMSIAAAPLDQIVSRWNDAVKDPDLMTVFRCDVQAMPQSTTQAITPDIIERSRIIEPFDFSLVNAAGRPRYAGLDTGNRCWFAVREHVSESERRMVWAEEIPLGDVVGRAVSLYHKMDISTLLIDAHPAVQEARNICYAIHGLNDYEWPEIKDAAKATITFPGGLKWDGENKCWKNLKCAVVEFTKTKLGMGIEHKLGEEEKDGKTRYFPIISCNRYETIDRVVKELLTPKENEIRVIDGELQQEPLMRFPRKVVGSPAAVGLLENHYVTGSRRMESDDGEQGDYVDKCENHFLLGGAYAGLAEVVGIKSTRVKKFQYSIPKGRIARRRSRAGGLV